MLILKRRWNFFLQVASHFPKTKPVTVTNVLLTCYIRITLLIQKISDLRSQDREKKSVKWKKFGEAALIFIRKIILVLYSKSANYF